MAHAEVRRYYENNTRRMLRWGPGRSEGVLHRPVWDPGLKERRDALHAVERRIAELLSTLAPRHLLDLGCGTGASALWLAERLPDLEPADTAYAIESFTHVESPGAFFAALRGRILPGGLLILCDDLLERSPPLHGTEARWVERFRTGWHLSSLSTLTEVRQQAEAQGFRLQLAEDLTPHLRLTPPPVLALRRLLPLLPLLNASARASLDGGTALQVCLHRGWVRYRFLVFRRGAA